ncbi:hypothetical protein C8R44DRAFT_855338 [Mycena epipterygia]|nr:hypothetical protein C8R44DRAFT_855338 [Mycena epipterygia]
MQDFAQELVDQIIDYIGPSNKADVAACGLVCRRWLPRSRFHLFSSITLSDSESDQQNVDSFFPLLDTSSSLLLSFVQVLTLHFCGQSFDDAHMATLVQSCPRLTTLRVKMVDDTLGSTKLHQIFRSLQIHIPVLGINSTSLSRLCVKVDADIPLSILVDIISALPLLEFLLIYSFPDSIVHDGSPLPCFSSPRLQTLECQGDNSASPFFSWILSASFLPIFKSLTLYTEITGVNDPIELYLQRAGPEIEFLSLTVWAYNGDLDIAFAVSRMAQYCCELRDLTLMMGRSASDILTLLSAISSSRLATLRISVGVTQGDGVLPWNLIDQALANPQFRALESFSLLRPAGNWENIFLINPEFKSRMPLANARGILD